ncbi:MAG: ABC transporter permease [Acidobacteriota bacterium]|nr:ABC transporter permease [Acidobacteriota bacterium]
MSIHDLKLRLRALIAPRRVERELDEELAFHIECETRKHVGRGLTPAEARTHARARFGSVALAADECRDARGTAFIDTTARDVFYALRAFRRAPLAALTIVATVALGLGLVAAVFTIYSALYLHVDNVRDPAALFEVRRLPVAGSTVWRPLTRAEYDAMKRETSDFLDPAGLEQGIRTRIEGRPANGTLVTGNFFQVLGIGASLGRTLLPADDQRHDARPVIVLSHKGWMKLLAGDDAVVGRTVEINGEPFDVVGVMPEGFRGQGNAAADYWAPLGLARQLRRAGTGEADDLRIETIIGRLKPGVSRETATAALSAWAAAAPNPNGGGRRASMALRPMLPTFSGLVNSLRVFGPIFIAFGLVLMIACTNVANLLMARGVSRQREIGIRLSLGASRARIIRQLLTESLVLAAAAAVCAFAVSRIVLVLGYYLIVTALPPEFAEKTNSAAPAPDWHVAIFLVAGAVVSTVLFGLMPALQATRLELVRTMRGELARDARPRRARHALIATQVGASALLLICAGVFLRSALASAARDPGVRTRDTVTLDIGDEARRAELIEAVRADPTTAAVAFSCPGVLGLTPTTLAEGLGAVPGAPSTRVGVGYQFVSPDYFDVLGIEIARGRGFTETERAASAGVAVVSESIAKRLWPDREAIGQVVRLSARTPGVSDAQSPAPRAFTVVGIARDIRHGLVLTSLTDAGIYLPIAGESAGTSLTVRVHGDPDTARRSLLDRLTRVDPSLSDVRTMRAMTGIRPSPCRRRFG